MGDAVEGVANLRRYGVHTMVRHPIVPIGHVVPNAVVAFAPPADVLCANGAKFRSMRV